MTYLNTTVIGQWAHLGRAVSLGIILALALGLGITTTLSAAGILPWLEIEARLGETPVPQMGMALQIAATLFAIGLCFFLPADRRMLRLEESHRDFHISMGDIARAYQAAHARDREGVFRLKSEFDAVRERLIFLRDHPDLRGLEPDVLEVAAQMSTISRDLADVYSHEKVDRARTFLRQRQQEGAEFDERLARVHETLRELRTWHDALTAEEARRDARVDQLEKDLFDMLPDLGFEVAMERIDPLVLEQEVAARKPNVVAIAPRGGGQSAT